MSTIDDRDDCADQALVRTESCTRWQCTREHYSSLTGDKRWTSPALVLRGRFWCCPSCGSSYGEHANGLPKTVNT